MEVVARRRNALSSFISKETEVGNDTEGTHLFKRRCYECFKHSEKINTPKLDSPVMLQIAINKLNYNLRTQNKTEHKSQPKKDVFFLTTCKV